MLESCLSLRRFYISFVCFIVSLALDENFVKILYFDSVACFHERKGEKMRLGNSVRRCDYVIGSRF